MTAEKILELTSKGTALMLAAQQVWDTVSPAVRAIFELIEKHKSGEEVTEADLAEVEAILDAQLEKFNEPLPEV